MWSGLEVSCRSDWDWANIWHTGRFAYPICLLKKEAGARGWWEGRTSFHIQHRSRWVGVNGWMDDSSSGLYLQGVLFSWQSQSIFITATGLKRHLQNSVTVYVCWYWFSRELLYKVFPTFYWKYVSLCSSPWTSAMCCVLCLLLSGIIWFRSMLFFPICVTVPPSSFLPCSARWWMWHYYHEPLISCPLIRWETSSQNYLLCSPLFSFIFSFLSLRLLCFLFMPLLHHLLTPPVMDVASAASAITVGSRACDARGPRGQQPSQNFPTRCSLNSSWETNEDEFGA